MADIIGSVANKVLDGRDISNFIPTIVSREMFKSCDELAAQHGRTCSLDSIVKEFVPLDPLNMIGYLQSDLTEFVVGLTPKSVAHGSLLSMYQPRGFMQGIEDSKQTVDSAMQSAKLPAPPQPGNGFPKPPTPRELFNF